MLTTTLFAIGHDKALAQTTDRNIVLQAEDAFGKSIGRESIGIYDADNVRGFSPADAGNLRIEGLFYDEQGGLAKLLTEEETVHVGIASQGYPFPAPTGIIDYRLRRAGEKPLLETVSSVDSWGGVVVDANLDLPRLVSNVSLSSGISVAREQTAFGGSPHSFAIGGVARWAPTEGVEILPFGGVTVVRDEQIQPHIFTNGTFLPPRIARRRYYGQKWALFDGDLSNFGLLAHARVAKFQLDAGIFRSISAEYQNYDDLLFDTDRSGAVRDRVVIAGTGDTYASTSGEVRISREMKDGPRTHTLLASVRARRQVRRYGGEQTILLGPSHIGRADYRDGPPPSQGPKTYDTVDQTTIGLSYQGTWTRVGEFGLGVQKMDYRKRVVMPAAAVHVPLSRATPLMWSATAAVYLVRRVAIYGGMTHGLEESAVAPANAVNLKEAPPAIRTRQQEAGLRWTVKTKLTLIAGVFTINKPYFNLDNKDVFRQLGQVSNRGVELSLSGEVVPGINILAGGLLFDGRVSGEEVDRGEIGSRPVGMARGHGIASVNVQVPGVPGLSVELSGDVTSSRVANNFDTLRVPAIASFGLAARYKVKVGPAAALVRLQLNNALDTFGWSVDGSGAFTANRPRRIELGISTDFAP